MSQVSADEYSELPTSHEQDQTLVNQSQELLPPPQANSSFQKENSNTYCPTTYL